jgi:uncharacterized protein (TIGR02145 family)
LRAEILTANLDNLLKPNIYYMKIKRIITLTALAFAFSSSVFSQVGIGTTTPDPSAELDVTSTSKGFLLPRMTTAQRTAISTPAAGLVIYNTTTSKAEVNVGTSVAPIWQATSGALPIGTSGQTLRHDGTNWVANSTVFNNGTNVGVGTTAPTAKLDVDGSAIFNESGAAVNFRVESDANTHHFFVDGTNNEIGVNTSTPASTLDIQGSLGYKVNTINGATPLDQTHNVVLCNTGPYTVTLPAASSNNGKVYYIKNIDAEGDDITIDGNASETIDGAAIFKLNSYNHTVRIVCDGANWHVLDETYTMSGGQIGGRNCDGSIFTWNDVANPNTGKIWMDRNLGASRVALFSSDANSYGDLYQWGRLKDGHQCRTSSITATLSSTDVPGNANFITINSGLLDWRNPQNVSLWQGVSGTNNPCPSGYRLPTNAEWSEERHYAYNAMHAFNSIIKLPVTGYRDRVSGTLTNVGNSGQYWSSTVSGTSAVILYFCPGDCGSWIGNYDRAQGLAVRCIKN